MYRFVTKLRKRLVFSIQFGQINNILTILSINLHGGILPPMGDLGFCGEIVC